MNARRISALIAALDGASAGTPGAIHASLPLRRTNTPGEPALSPGPRSLGAALKASGRAGEVLDQVLATCLDAPDPQHATMRTRYIATIAAALMACCAVVPAVRSISTSFGVDFGPLYLIPLLAVPIALSLFGWQRRLHAHQGAATHHRRRTELMRSLRKIPLSPELTLRVTEFIFEQPDDSLSFAAPSELAPEALDQRAEGLDRELALEPITRPPAQGRMIFEPQAFAFGTSAVVAAWVILSGWGLYFWLLGEAAWRGLP
ncbi:MAG: hypothetical protein IPK13_02790 [Deltaproteobacteria bacterium]|nr:hypothetical protein [Deltaproteobacteria bacterium]